MELGSYNQHVWNVLHQDSYLYIYYDYMYGHMIFVTRQGEKVYADCNHRYFGMNNTYLDDFRCNLSVYEFVRIIFSWILMDI